MRFSMRGWTITWVWRTPIMLLTLGKTGYNDSRFTGFLVWRRNYKCRYLGWVNSDGVPQPLREG